MSCAIGAPPPLSTRRMSPLEFAKMRWIMRLHIEMVSEGRPMDGTREYEWNMHVQRVAPLRYPIDGTTPQLFVSLQREPARRGDYVPRDVCYECDGRCVWIDLKVWCGSGLHKDHTVAHLRYEAYGLRRELLQHIELVRPNVVPNLGNILVRAGEWPTDPKRVLLACATHPLIGRPIVSTLAQSTIDLPTRWETDIDRPVCLWRFGTKPTNFANCVKAAECILKRSARHRASHDAKSDTVGLLATRLYFTLDDDTYFPYLDTYGYSVTTLGGKTTKHERPAPPPLAERDVRPRLIVDDAV